MRTRGQLLWTILVLIISLLVLSPFQTVVAQVQDTLVGGTIASNATWTAANSPYIVTSDIVINPGVTLTIQAGVEVRFNAQTDLFVNGALIADGGPTDSIVFTANTATPTVGFWGGIVFSNTATVPQSLLDHCVIKYSGNGGFGGSLSPIYLDARSNPSMTNLTLYNNKYNSIQLLATTYNQNITLDIVDKPYFFLGADVTIAAGSKLTIRPGAILKFFTAVDLFIAGALDARGEIDSTITFTSFRDDSAGSIDTDGLGPSVGQVNDWGGVVFSLTAIIPQSFMDHCVIKYSGNGGFGGSVSPIYLDARSNPDITNITLYNNKYNSIQLLAATYNQNITLDIVDKPYFFQGADVTIAAGSKLTIRPGAILKFFTAVDLFIDGALDARGEIDSTITFTSFRDDSAGSIDTDGGGSSIGQVNDWGGIVFSLTATIPQSFMDHCVIKYSGNGGFGGSLSPIYLDARSNPDITNITLYNNKYNSIQLLATTYNQNITLDIVDKPYFFQGADVTIAAGSKLTIRPGAILKFFTAVDLFIDGALDARGEIDSTITFTSFRDDSAGSIDTDGGGSSIGQVNDWGGIVFSNTATIPQSFMDHCVIKYSGNGGFGGSLSPIYLDARSNPDITNITLYNNKYNSIQLLATTYNQNITLDIVDKPYFFQGADVTIAAGSKLTIRPGAILKFFNGVDLFINGALDARGEISSTITFTSFRDDSAGSIDTDGLGPSVGLGDDWGGIIFNDASLDSLCIISHAIVSFGGGTASALSALLACSNASPKIEESRFVARWPSSIRSGIRCAGSAKPDLGGGSCGSVGLNSFEGFVGSDDFAVYNDGTSNIRARFNCWGTQDSAQIEQIIYDMLNNPARGRVFFSPIQADCNSGTFSIQIGIQAGWNMISNPVTTTSDSVKQLFPMSSFNYAFKFSGTLGYVQDYTVDNRVGYWGKFPAATPQTVAGKPRSCDSVHVSAGWNMVGSVSITIDTSGIASVPAGIRSSDWFGYDSGYFSATQIVAGKAYWVKASAPGVFIFDSTTPFAKTRSGK